jgi:fructose-specific phosphotransferase system IIC component
VLAGVGGLVPFVVVIGLFLRVAQVFEPGTETQYVVFFVAFWPALCRGAAALFRASDLCDWLVNANSSV